MNIVTCKHRYVPLCALLLAGVLAGSALRAAAADAPDAAAEREAQLIATLRSDSPPSDKAMACKQLAIYGGPDAVPALAALLADKELSSWARIALEVIPGPAADAALREALGKLQGRLAIGAINSLAFRRDAQATETLAARLQDDDAEVASAAAAALGRIATAPAVGVLEQALTGAPVAVRGAVAEGLILAAENRLAAGQADEARRLYDLVRQADVPKLRALEATRGAILAAGSAGVPLLLEQLQANDRDAFAIGLRTARDLAGSAVTEALMAELDRAAPERKALLIQVLADRGDAEALPAVLQTAQSGSAAARVAAIRVLKRLGNASCVPVLLDAALDADAAVAQAAANVLADLSGQDIDQDLAARLPQATGRTRQLLIEIAGRRRIAAAVPALLQAAEDSAVEIRVAALTALGYAIDFRDLSALIARVANPPANADEAAAAERALQAACVRMPAPDATAAGLQAAMAQAPLAARIKLLETLTAVGGDKALEIVAGAARDTTPEIQDAGSRLLGEWMSVDAGPVLLDLARTTAEERYKIRALRGYIRLVRQFTMPDEQRAAMCRAALQAAERDAERKLILEVMQRNPSLDMLRVAVEAAKMPSIKTEAATIAMALAQQVGGQAADVQQLLAQVGHDPVKIEIVKAEYGVGTQVRDVTEMLRRRVRDLPLIVLQTSGYNTAFGGDPAPGVVKQLKIQYRINDKPGEVSFPENAMILLPMPR